MLRLIENIKSMDKVNYTQNQDISNSLTHLLGLPITLIIFFYSFTIIYDDFVSMLFHDNHPSLLYRWMQYSAS